LRNRGLLCRSVPAGLIWSHASVVNSYDASYDAERMASSLHRLTPKSIAALKKVGMHADGGGLYVRVYAAKPGQDVQRKVFVFVFYLHGTRREMGLGNVNTVKLADARTVASDARELVAKNLDPRGERKRLAEEAAQAERDKAAAGVAVQTFGEFADEYVENLARTYKTVNNWTRAVKVYAAPLRDKRCDEITTDDILDVVRPLLKRVPVAGEKTMGYLKKILAAAKLKGLRTGDNPAAYRDHLELLIQKPKPLTSKGHHPALSYTELPAFMAELRRHTGFGTRALELAILTAKRTTEVVWAQWPEFDFERKVWTIPAKRMKPVPGHEARDHRVPLSDDAITMLKALPRSTVPGRAAFVFQGSRNAVIDGMSMTRTLTRLGVKDRATVHGFRSTFRDWFGVETDFPSELGEMALAHKVGDDVENAYRRADMLDKRVPIMDAWADYCTGRTPLRKAA
jgi:integrase